MTFHSTPEGLNGLVDLDRGIISREIFVNEELYRQEHAGNCALLRSCVPFSTHSMA
jgi:hypothetical protein